MGINLADIRTEILKVKGDWLEVLNDCRSTVRKTFSTKDPTEGFKRSILIAEHSPIRDIIIKWRWLDIPYWVSVHWVRHKWECFVSTQRSDRTGQSREGKPQEEPVDFTGEANIQHLIDSMRKRLCHQASPETRAYAESLVKEIEQIDNNIALVLVPNCVYRCGCPEMKCCGEWQRFLSWVDYQGESMFEHLPIEDRYWLWHRYKEFQEVSKGE